MVIEHESYSTKQLSLARRKKVSLDTAVTPIDEYLCGGGGGLLRRYSYTEINYTSWKCIINDYILLVVFL